jgi:aminomethyltransferase
MTDPRTAHPEPVEGLHTALHEEHLRLGARMVPFAGWHMPVQYEGIVEEHHAVRRRAGMFDVSHMGRYEIHGPQAAAFLRYVNTWDVTSLTPGEGHYSAMCREAGGILDDVYVFNLDPTKYLLVVNAANAPKIREWITPRIERFDATLVDRHASTVMIAVQGPEALARCAAVTGEEFVRAIKPRRCAETAWRGQTLFASRTGYTGEDGLELVVEARAGPDLWRALLDAGVTPCGLGARDTLRLEAALLLYGNDMDESTNAYEVGLAWVVSLDDGADFIGRDALVRLKDVEKTRELVCLQASDRGIMRSECPIRSSGAEVGKVTSGGYSPTLETSIGMGFVPPALATRGTTLDVEVRGKTLPVRVVPRPFYKRPKA